MINLNEAFSVSRGKDERGNIIAFIDPNKPENKKSYDYRQIFSKHKAKWSGKYWFWYVGKTEDQWRKIFSMFIEPALKEVHSLESAPEDQGKAAIIASLDALISQIDTTPVDPNSDVKISKEKEEEIKTKLAFFKQKLVNIENDEDFKNAVAAITKFKNAQGQKFSFNNAILIIIQNPRATIVNSKTNWEKIYNRTIKPNANPLMIFAPNTQGGGVYGLSKEKKQEITNNFLKQIRKTDISQLSPNEKIRLQELLRPTTYARSFLVVPVFDVSDTIQIEGKEDFIKGTEDFGKLQWHQGDSTDEAVKPIYNALIDVAKALNINVNQAAKDQLGGARGVSKSGSIEVLQNEGNDVGLTKTLAHELTHELLHQKYAGSKNPQVQQFFIGKQEGRAAMEQQAELSAWMFMDAYGFDVKTTSLNYTLIWGGNKDNMVKVFDTVSGVVNYLIDQVNERLKASHAVSEMAGQDLTPHLAQHIDGADVAKFLGIEQDYDAAIGHQSLKERFFNLVNK